MSQRQRRTHRPRSLALRLTTHHRLPILGAAVASLGVAGVAMGQSVSWVGPVGVPAPFEVGANWSDGTVPGTNALAFIDNGGIASLTTHNGTVLALTLGSGTGTSGSMVQGGGSLSS